MEALQLAHEAHDLLDEAIEEAFSYRQTFLGQADMSDWEEMFIYRHSKHILYLAWDVCLLQSEKRIYAAPNLVRSILESLFCIGATKNNNLISVECTLYDIKRQIAKYGDILDEDVRRDLDAFYNSLSKEFPKISPRKRNVRELAKIADLESMYFWYGYLSSFIHADLFGLVCGEASGQHGSITNILTGSLAITTSLLAGSVPTSNPQGFIDVAATILERSSHLHDSGSYKAIDEIFKTS